MFYERKRKKKYRIAQVGHREQQFKLENLHTIKEEGLKGTKILRGKKKKKNWEDAMGVEGRRILFKRNILEGFSQERVG